MFPLPSGVIPVSMDVLPPPKYKLQFNDIIEIRENENLGETFDSHNPFQATLISNNRVTHKEHFQDTRLVEMKISDKIDFNPGDICLVQPTNSQKNVDTFIEMMSHLLEMLISITLSFMNAVTFIILCSTFTRSWCGHRLE